MWIALIIFIAAPVIITMYILHMAEKEYIKLKEEIFEHLTLKGYHKIEYADKYITVKSRKALETYTDIKLFKDNEGELERAKKIVEDKEKVKKILTEFLKNNAYEAKSGYPRVKKDIVDILYAARGYRAIVEYISSAGNNLGSGMIELNKQDLDKFSKYPSLLMSKSEYNKFVKEQLKEELNRKHQDYYDKVNDIIDYANENNEKLVIKSSEEQLDDFISNLFEKTINTIKKIKTIDSQEWDMIDNLINHTKKEVENLVENNQKILDYYESDEFNKIKESCELMMSTQREFNEYILEKVQSISKLFGARVSRNETAHNDEFNYIRPYKKTITPFTAEVSATVFASAENNPLEYVIKNFYPNKQMYPEQITKLHHLIDELETLKDAKQIIDNYKQDYHQYLSDVPEFIMQQDEAGFYSRIGFANIDESVLVIEYKFVYTSNGGMAQRSFTVPMTEETIIQLIKSLENKLTFVAFAKEQRMMMTKKMREYIKSRDNYTCCECGNSTHNEPNLLLEIDHIIPVSKGGYTLEDNLQTLCWKCNRTKSNKIKA